MGVSLFSHVTNNRTRRNVLKMDEGRFRLSIKKNFKSVVRHWNREMVKLPSLEVLTKLVDVVLGNVV